VRNGERRQGSFSRLLGRSPPRETNQKPRGECAGQELKEKSHRRVRRELGAQQGAKEPCHEKTGAHKRKCNESRSLQGRLEESRAREDTQRRLKAPIHRAKLDRAGSGCGSDPSDLGQETRSEEAQQTVGEPDERGSS